MEYTLKKSLGQHFLRDEQICQRIVASLEAPLPAAVLEVGPGDGALTKYLMQREDFQLKCIEVDEEKVHWLLQHYPALQGKLLHGSFLDLSPPFEEPFAIIGNFPYNISTQILFKVLTWRDQVPLLIGMFQKEVAQRIAATAGNKTYGILSVLVQAYYEVQYLFEVSERCFQPPPKVKSAVLRLRKLAVAPAVKSEALFFQLVKTAFNQRRKKLRNAVRFLFEEEVLAQALFDQRAEQLSIQDFAQLTFLMKAGSSTAV